MKLKTGFITHTIGKEQMMVATGPAGKDFHGLVRSNETAAFIVDCLKKETTEEEIVAAASAAGKPGPDGDREEGPGALQKVRCRPF